MQGVKNANYDKVLAKNISEFKVKSGRVNIVLGSLESGEFTVCQNNRYGSGMITPILNSNAILITTEDESIVKKDSIIKVIIF